MANSILNDKIKIKNLEIKNRVVLPPMCQFVVEKEDGIATDWHQIHYASRAIGGTGLIIVEATACEPDGRITNKDLGLWNDEQKDELKKVVDLIHKYGSKACLQISHAGRKAEDAVYRVAPSATKIGDVTPNELKPDEIDRIIESFASSCKRAVDIGFDSIELHGAHGYLVHQFHSKIINKREDEYGKDPSLFGVKIIKRFKEIMPKDMPLLMRLSAIEYVDGGYDIDYCLEIAKKYEAAGVDCFDISTGGEDTPGKLKPGNYPGYQLPFAKVFKDNFDLPIISAGMLEDPSVANYALLSGQADMVAIGRGMLEDPYWTIHAMQSTETKNIPIPKAYARGIRNFD